MSASTPHAALRAASAIARDRGSFSTPADLGRQVKALLPDVSAAACRRAANVVIDAREAQQTLLAAGRTTAPRQTPARFSRAPGSIKPIADRLAAHRRAQARKAFLAANFRVGPDVTILVVLDDDGRAGVALHHDREWRSGRGGGSGG